jgi:hypothetical protein
MVVTVEAAHGNYIPAINREDVVVLQGTDQLHVTEWTALQGERSGLELFILIDDSSTESLGSQLANLREFIEVQPARTLIGIAYMHNGIADIAQNLTDDHGKAAKALRLPFGSSAGASPFLAVSDLVRKWPQSSARREMLLISSGADPLGGFAAINPYLDIAIQHAQMGGVIVYAIYSPSSGHAGHSFVHMSWGQNYLARLAEETGGESHMLGFEPAVSFAPYLKAIAENLKNQFSVSFLAKPADKPALVSVRFSTEVPNLEIVAATKVLVWPDNVTSGENR